MRRFVPCLLVFGLFPISAMLQAGEESDAIKNLLARIRKGDSRVVPALAKHGEKAVPGLIAILKEGNPSVQVPAMDALAQIGPAAKEAVPLLAEAMTEGTDDKLASHAAQALGHIGAAAVPELVNVLEKGNAKRVVMAARAVAQVGPAAKAAQPALVKHLKDAKEPLEEAIFVDALVALGPAAKDAVPMLVTLAKAQKDPARIHVLVGLGKIGPAAKEAVPYLASVMNDEKLPPNLRVHALESLSQVAPDSKELIDVVPSMLKGGMWPRGKVIATLARTGPVSKEARTILEEGLSSKDPTMRVLAAQGLGKSDPKNSAVVSVLIEAFGEKDAQVRRLAAVAIGEIRPGDPAVARTLEKAAADPDLGVRQAAAEALKKLEKK
jgi:HEAT repeat protein